MDIFGREVRLNAGSMIKTPLTIHFDVEFDDTETINKTTVKAYNLSNSTISKIKKGRPALLSAGYKDDTSVIFQGIIDDVQTTWSGVDKITELSCSDEHGQFLKKKVSRTFAPGTSSTTVLRYLIGQSGLGYGDFSPPKTFVYRNGTTLNGVVSELMKKAVQDAGAKMHITRNKIYIRDNNKGDDIGYVVNKEHGLIDSPEKIESEYEDKATGEKRSRSGWKVKTLLNHRITVDSIIVLQSKTVNGAFRVAKGNHICDGSQFYTIVEVF